MTFDSFEAAVNEFKLAVANLPAAREFVSGRDFESFYLPPSKTYIAMIPRGGGRPTAWINKGYASFLNDEGTEEHIAFPENKRGGSGRNAHQRRREEAEKRICPTPGCGMVLSASGICDYC